MNVRSACTYVCMHTCMNVFLDVRVQAHGKAVRTGQHKGLLQYAVNNFSSCVRAEPSNRAVAFELSQCR